MIANARSLLIAVVSFAAVLIFSTSGIAQSSAADQLNQDGFSCLQNGAATEALSVWQEAEELYRAAGDEEAIIGTQLNQSLAQQALGLYPRACATVAQAIALQKQVCQPNQGAEYVVAAMLTLEPTEVNALGARLLGESLTLLGNLAEAQAALNFAQTHPLADPTESSRVALAAGNVHRLLAQEALQTYERLGSREVQLRRDTTAQISSEIASSIAQYQIASSNDSGIGTKAGLNLVDLFVDVHSTLRGLPTYLALAVPEFQQLDSNAQAMYVALNEGHFTQLPTIDAIYGRLNLAENLIAIRQHDGFEQAFWEEIAIADIEPLIRSAQAEAERIEDKRALSFAYGMAADLKVLKAAPMTEIKADYSQALAIAQSIQASDAAYEWAYKLAQLEEEAGQRDAAAQYYKNAISALGQVREDLVAVNTELRFNFKEKIEPVYRNYIKLLVAEGNGSLSQAVATHDSLQLAQLENFLRCGRLLAAAPETADGVSIHVMNLGSAIEVIVTNQEETYGYSLPLKEVLRAAENLILNIQSPSFLAVPEAEFLPYAQLLYDQLVRPAVASGLISDSDHLSFVLDAPFRALPMGLLHDGQQYLAATHPLSNSLQLQVFSTQQSSGNRALFAGISQEAPSFIEPSLLPLPETEFEAESVKGYMRSKVLLNDDFTVERLKRELRADDYKIVHLSTHGQFSSSPEQTFLAAWNGLIHIQDMANIFQRAGSIDLLVLSACQTASDDDRATLGLAGIAVQSGARSAIASLWLVDSTGSSVLMDRFYQAKNQGLGTAEALQQSQVELMTSSTFSHPFYWAPFILISG